MRVPWKHAMADTGVALLLDRQLQRLGRPAVNGHVHERRLQDARLQLVLVHAVSRRAGIAAETRHTGGRQRHVMHVGKAQKTTYTTT